MAEAEDVITDAARHATIFARALWQRHRQNPNAPKIIQLSDVADRLDLLIGAVFATHYPLRIAQRPAPRTLLATLFRRSDLPMPPTAVPATDGRSLWLPSDFQSPDVDRSLEQFRTMALQQAMRAYRGSAQRVDSLLTTIERDTYLVVEACACDEALSQLLPGMAEPIHSARRNALNARPRLDAISPWYRPLENLLRAILQSRCGAAPANVGECTTPYHSMALAKELASKLALIDPASPKWGPNAVCKDYWTGDLLLPAVTASDFHTADGISSADKNMPLRSARLTRRPKTREVAKDEDDEQQGLWMIQPSAPIEHAEDPMGMQRPTDRDDQTPAEEFADSLSELAEARLVSTPDRPKDVLLSDDPPEGHATTRPEPTQPTADSVHYPEWDYRMGAYRNPGTTVHLLAPAAGPKEWVEETLEKHRSMLNMIRRRFEMLRPERSRIRKQLEGDSIDLAAYIDALSDTKAGHSMSQALYENQRPGKRDMSILLLIDISSSTDSWLSANQRVIDIEREALLLVCSALEGLGEPYSVQAFSGEGPHGVTISAVKQFAEPYDTTIAQRIAALEPEHYTRTGAAIRHASMLLMKQSSQHRLLLLLSDGKPNDADDYEGRYGVEDMRQAVSEAKLQGIFPFCLTIDRQAANYLPAVFGPRQYALLPKPELLPTVLLDWMRRLLSR
ncbi:VWA domain-containing protein [Candidimonas sp. SYP-B2681]|uniref:nitric oxide reductase activation protein NorD n=1 Tax=Candidimonas sp. SYP-B2681 TaxID=2497686 RepID=UPI000F864826|nr:VWA domain-containing protein [Candidimonas sp. SYP-B2681]RTZ40965.1 VWA domain-containing protein [Candidimonas sp. SYP-B2681]